MTSQLGTGISKSFFYGVPSFFNLFFSLRKRRFVLFLIWIQVQDLDPDSNPAFSKFRIRFRIRIRIRIRILDSNPDLKPDPNPKLTKGRIRIRNRIRNKSFGSATLLFGSGSGSCRLFFIISDSISALRELQSQLALYY